MYILGLTPISPPISPISHRFDPNLAGDKIPHQKGRTDKNGVVSFLPDRQGKWLRKVSGESEHGIHGAQVKVQVNKSLLMESFKKPLVAIYTKLFVGLGFIMGIFGLWALLKVKKTG